MNYELFEQPASDVVKRYPYLSDFLSALGLTLPRRKQSLAEFFAAVPAAQLVHHSLDHQTLTNQCLAFIEQMENFRQQGRKTVREVTIERGYDKSGNREKSDVALRAGDVVAVVGPTGSGKSRLLADIECLAQRDTPSGRRILLDGHPPDECQRLSGEQQLVAQLSQNMNFVMDLSVGDFLRMHAESRLVGNVEEKIGGIYTTAVALAGEPFTIDTPVTDLSGGQSRALMIADVACLSASPIVLIDEIENAGVDRRRALELLIEEEKIVLMATHDPLLALSAQRRLVVANGGIAAILSTSDEERGELQQLLKIDRTLSRLREKIRRGEHLTK